MAASDRVFEILLVEDNEGDVTLIKEAWSQCTSIRTHISVLRDSKDAIVYLRGFAPYEKVPKPDLILVDYKLPVNGGIALTEIKGDPDYLHIPVVVLTGSMDPRDYLDAYRRHANGVFRKPTELNDFMSLICSLGETWLLRAALPA